MILGITICKRSTKIGFLWLKVSYATLIFLKYFNFISKKSGLGGSFFVFWGLPEAETGVILLKINSFIVKLVSDFP